MLLLVCAIVHVCIRRIVSVRWIPGIQVATEILPPSKSTSNQPLLRSYSQVHEDIDAYNHFFYGTVNGTYLEMGARDGILHSNTLAFHESLGWRGILIEASTSFHGLLHHRPKDICIWCAVCDSVRKVHWIGQKGGTSGIYEFMTPQFRKVFHPSVNTSDLREVKCYPLSVILSELCVSSIDFFSLDVEGAELSVMRTIDWTRVTFKVIVIETVRSNRDPRAVNEIFQILLSAGYHPYNMSGSVNSWFVHHSFHPSSLVG